MNTTRHLAVLFALAAVIGAACGGAQTSSSSLPSPPIGGPVTTEADAVARVIGAEPRLTGIMKRDPDLIGQSSWYEVAPASGVGAFLVNVRVGWGDCFAGCIDDHTWLYAVGPDGTVTMQSEIGGEVPPDAWPGASQ